MTVILRDRIDPPFITAPPRDINEIRARVTPQLQAEFAEAGLTYGAPVFMRIFKEERVLEFWVQNGHQFELFKTYGICNYSGALGPKLREGDWQSPEGFYFVPPGAMNPNSSYHLSFNLGFPNRFDHDAGRTGSFLMVHGDCVSVGCYAMTDAQIEEIYVIAEAAHTNGQPFFRVHAFPFRMTDDRLMKEQGTMWYAFWQNLKQGYDAFENTRNPPDVTVEDGRYVFG
ncbi:murein L,D-transpeptidase [Sulfitobacter sp. 1151]|uniref:Murein L,D-transpeptidase n=1 Tax=Parasulfitobacter algicola TaxID=2614809 RepID=A0ABX2J078_9RHOB|nr:murein L,D-transpeptidase [Sulfitobacter algicola]